MNLVISGFLTAFILLPSSITWAQTITMYDQPAAEAKAVGIVDLSAGIIPIYNPNQGDWVKIADPKNGNVGWVKKSEVTKSSETKSTYQIIQYGNPVKNPGANNLGATIQEINKQSEAIQKGFQEIGNLLGPEFQEQWNKTPHNTIMMPIIVIPEPKGLQKPATTTNPAATNTAPATKR